MMVHCPRSHSNQKPDVPVEPAYWAPPASELYLAIALLPISDRSVHPHVHWILSFQPFLPGMLSLGSL